jgi:hypothetical protein
MLTRFDIAALRLRAGRHGGRAPVYAIQRGREAPAAAPAIPFRRVAAKAAAPFARPGRLADLLFARALARVTAGRAVRSVRFEYAERWFGDDLVAEIDPNRLEHELVESVDDGGKPVRLSHWFLDGGDWTDILRPLRPSEVQLEIDAVFDHGDRLEESPAFRALLANSEAGRPSKRNRLSLTSPELIRSYLEQYRDLRRSIEEHGFRRRAGVPSAEARLFAGTAVRDKAAERREREIGLAVGPDGTLFRITGGRHRTALAQRLKLPRIPAQVRLVHVAWLEGWIARTGLPPRQALITGIRSLAA